MRLENKVARVALAGVRRRKTVEREESGRTVFKTVAFVRSATLSA